MKFIKTLTDLSFSSWKKKSKLVLVKKKHYSQPTGCKTWSRNIAQSFEFGEKELKFPDNQKDV